MSVKLEAPAPLCRPHPRGPQATLTSVAPAQPPCHRRSLLLDAVPWGAGSVADAGSSTRRGGGLAGIAERGGLTGLHQLTAGMFTTTTLLSMFHGRLPSDLVPGGVGYLSHQEDRYYEWMERRDINLVDLLKLAGFEVRLHHHLDFLLRMILGFRAADPVLEFEEALKMEDRFSHVSLSGWSAERSKLDVFSEYGNKTARDEFYSNEAEYIRKLQAEECEGNLFFVTQQQDWHDAWYTKDMRALPGARARAEQWLSQWDFSEPDAAFWVFSDHGYQVSDDVNPKDTLAWVLYRDNTAAPLQPARRVISSLDFYATILHKAGLDQYSEEARDSLSIHLPAASAPRRRIFFGEDSRVKSDARFACSSVVSCLSTCPDAAEPEDDADSDRATPSEMDPHGEHNARLLMLVYHARHGTVQGYSYDFWHENPYAYDTVDINDLLATLSKASKASKASKVQFQTRELCELSDWEALIQALQTRFSWAQKAEVQQALEALSEGADARVGADAATSQPRGQEIATATSGSGAGSIALVGRHLLEFAENPTSRRRLLCLFPAAPPR